MTRFLSLLLMLPLLSFPLSLSAQNNDDLVAESINRVFYRFDEVKEPAFSDDFILADVMLNPDQPRRFSDFSGDISGRFLGAVAMTSRGEKDDLQLQRLMGKLLPCQRADGRFGNESLSFTAADIGPDQMALLWGNGRLLVGLLEYHERFPEETAVLEAATRLGDFLLKVFDECATEEVMTRVRGMAANGFICFTQFNEGLELLARATKEEHYRDTAKRMEALLEPRGIQHTHGYLTTLRGHMLIYETTGEEELLAAVEARFADMEESGSIMINGGLLEFFKEDYDRDEGCTEADFLRLCLQLWRATGKEQYLVRAEHCLNNIFYANQFETGDFGHRCFNKQGYIPHAGGARAWWCCTMHGLRALHDVIDFGLTAIDDGVQVNLWHEGSFKDGAFQVKLQQITLPEKPHLLAFMAEVVAAPEGEQTLALRVPGWAKSLSATVSRDGQSLEEMKTESPSAAAVSRLIAQEGTLLNLRRQWRNGEAVVIQIDCALRLADRAGQIHTLAELPDSGAEERALFFGPWLMGVDAHTTPMFHGEPYLQNILLLPEDDAGVSAVLSMTSKEPGNLQAPELTLSYVHQGFFDLCTVVMQPIAAQSYRPQTTVSYWHWMRRSAS
ncbi:MAG: hypothetical protein GX130_14495 [Candidatus Hydrogenedens sp.]|jgi:hypothetical protein|nr:hypothetical protein [Candidatus Hydrogenedens sp.]